MPRRRRSQQVDTFNTTDVPLPKRRRKGEAGPSRRSVKIDKQDALLAVEQAFVPRLVNVIQSAVKSESKKKKRLSEDEFKEKMEAVKTGLLGSKSVPRGIFDDADQIRQLPSFTVSITIGSHHDILARWHTYVNQTFEGLIQNAWEVYKNISAQADQAQSSIPAPDRTRTCGVVLEKVFRQDLPQDFKALFLQRLKDTAVSLTNMKADLAAIMRALMLEGVTKGYRSVEGNLKCNTTEERATQLVIEQFLSPAMVRHTQFLVDDRYIPVAPLPDNVATVQNNVDYHKLFTEEHVTYVYSRDISGHVTSESNHPLWDQLCVALPFEVNKLLGLSHTASTVAFSLGTQIQTLWNGGLFDIALKRLLLIYYRGKLAPQREQRYKDLLAKMSADTADRRKNRKNSSRSKKWQRRRKEKRHMEKCLSRMKSAVTPVDKAKWEERWRLSNERLAEMDKTTNDTVMVEAVNDEALVEADSEEIDPTLMKFLDLGLSEDAIQDLAADGQLEDEEEEKEEEEEEAAEVDSSAAMIRQLVAFTKAQLYDSAQVEDLSQKIATKWKGRKTPTEREINAIQHIYLVLKPYMPPKDIKPCIALRLPIVVISNIVQRVAGYQSFTRSICPIISPARIQSFSVDAVAIYELMGSNKVDENFTMMDQNNMPISSTKWAVANKEATFSSFLDVQKIKKKCAKHGLVFLHRFIYKADDSVDLVGELHNEVTPAISFYDQRRKLRAGGTKRQSSKNLTVQQNQLINTLNAQVDELSKSLRRYASDLKNKRAHIWELKLGRKSLQPGQERHLSYLQLKGEKSERNSVQKQVFDIKKQLKEAKAQVYEILYAKVNKDNEPIPPPPPTNTRVGHEDDAKHIQIGQLLSEAAVDGREVVYSGTDYGIRTQSTTVRMTVERFQAHLSLYNYFETLNNGQEHDTGSTASNEYAQNVRLASPAKENCHRVTSGQLSQASLGRALARRSERRKSNNSKVQEAEKRLSTCSTKEANNAADVLRRHKIGQEQRQELRGFYYSKRRKKEHHTAHLLLGRAYDRFASKERRFITENLQSKKTAHAVMCIGQCGTGVGSRIGGHVRYGGSQFRRRHRRYAVVAMTNEHNSSQTCCICMSPVVRPQKRVQIKGKWQTRSVNGSSICFNTDCPSYKSGCNTKNRDVEAAVCIALAGMGTMLTGHTLPPFKRKTSQSYTGQTSNRVPPVTGAALVTATAGLP